MTEPDAPTEAPAQTAARRRRGALGWALIALAVLAVLLVGALAAGRWGVLSPAGRELVMSFVAGKKIGRYGRIEVEGLRGDLWDEFTLERVTVSDAEGVWLEALDVRVDWSYLPLLMRRFHADEVEARVVRVLRRPLVEPRINPPGPMPLSIDIDAIDARVELHEGFSETYGRWEVAGDLLMLRDGAKSGRLDAFSLTRPGDYVRADFFMEDLPSLRFDARAFEARGGPIAGALGYAPDQPFLLNARLDDGGLDALVRTGAFTPLRVKGQWSGDGGVASGYVSFRGSELLRPFAERLGETARFGLALVPARDRPGRFGLGWTLRADNLTSRARGLVERDGGAPEGLTLRVATPSVSRLAGRAISGPGAFEGVWRGTGQRWTLDGRMAVDRAAMAGYSLDRVSGPVKAQWRRGRLDLDADLNGRGGAGSSLLARLLGAQPTARVELARLADARLLLERVRIDGAAIDVQGSGGRTLAGGLAFRGQAQLADASRLRAPASGALSADWRATQARGGRPWSFSFEADGRRFASGWGQLDRLLGPAPHLVAAGALENGRIAVERSQLDGQAGRLNARGLIGLGGADMRLALDWTARGPFAVGPVEVVGDAAGRGALTGTLARPRLDLIADFDQVDAGPLSLNGANLVLTFHRGDGLYDGRATLTGGTNYGPARAATAFQIRGFGVRLTGLDVDAGGVQARGDLALRNSAPSSADLTFVAGPGAFLASGQARGRVRLTDGADDATAMVDIRGDNLRFAGSGYVIRTLRLTGEGETRHLPFDLTADVGGTLPASFQGGGVYARDGEAQTVTLTGRGRVREVAYATRTPAVIALAGDGRVVRLDLDVGGGVLEGELRQDSAAALLQASLRAVDLRSFSPDLAGRISADVALRGSGSALDGNFNARLMDARSRDASTDMDIDATVNGVLQGDRLQLTAEAADAGGVRSSARLDLPVDASAAPLRLAVARTRPMSGDVTLQGQIRSLWDLVMGGERSLAGVVDGRATLAGTLNEPEAVGHLNIRDGRFEDARTGVVLDGLVMRAVFDAASARIQTFTATDGRRGDPGRVSGQGVLSLRRGGASTFTVQLTDFRVIDTDLAVARASGPVTASRTAAGALQLNGDLLVTDAEISAADLPNRSGVVQIEVVEVNRPGGDVDREEPVRAGPDIGLDVRLRAPGGRVHVRGRGLDVDMSLRAQVGGSLARPELSGEARVVRGDYEFAGKRFIFDQTGSVTLSTQLDQIRLDLRAVREDPALTAEIRVGGTAARPTITLASTPSLPQDEILSQVLFGRSASQLSPIEAAQLASSVASLAGGGGLDVFGNLREFAGLDRLSFGGDASGLTVAGGKYISDDVYFEIIGGGVEGAAVQVEWRARRNVSVVSRVGGQGDARLSVRWRRQSRDRPERGSR